MLDGNTALHEAAGGDFENVPAVRTLLELGAEVDAVNNEGETALIVASARGEDTAVALLLEAGADPRRRTRRGWRFWRKGDDAIAVARAHLEECRELASAEPGQLPGEALELLREIDEPDKDRIADALEADVARERAEPDEYRTNMRIAVERAERTLALLTAAASR